MPAAATSTTIGASLICARLPNEINAKGVILDGEIVVLHSSGKARFCDLMGILGRWRSLRSI